MAENPPPYHLVGGFVRHTASAYRVLFSPDGLLLAMSFGNTAEIQRFNSPNSVYQRGFIGHEGHVTDLSFSTDSELLATSSEDSTIRVWDINGYRFKKLMTTNHNVPELCVKFNPQSNMIIASGSSEGSVRIWDVDSGACIKVLPKQPGNIATMDYSPDGSMIVAGSFGGLCRIWDTATGNEIVTIKPPGYPPVGSVKFSSDGKYVLVGLMDSTLWIWNMVHGGMLPTIYGGHVNKNVQILSTFITSDERFIVSGSEDNCLYFWDTCFETLVQRIDQAHAAPVQCVSCHPILEMMASASYGDNNTVKVWKKIDVLDLPKHSRI